MRALPASIRTSPGGWHCFWVTANWPERPGREERAGQAACSP